MKKMTGIVAILVGLVAILIIWNVAAVVVPEGEQVVITQFGEAIEAYTEPGLYWKTPFIQNVVVFPKRLLIYEGEGTGVITKDKKNLHVDNYARWRISEPIQFMAKAGSLAAAQKLLDDIVYSELRAELARHDLIDIVDQNRETIVEQVTAVADVKAREVGIQIVDVRIKRADLPQENQNSVFQRMQSERQRQATQYRSEGEEAAAKIRAATDKERAIILAEAYRQSQILRGEGEAEAAQVYNDALGQDADFYSFIRTLEAYQKIMDAETRLILTPDSELLRYLQSASGQ